MEKKEKRLLMSMLKHVFTNKSMMFSLGILLALGVVFGQAIPLINAYLIDNIIVTGAWGNLVYYILIVVAVLTLEGICIFLQRFFINRIGYKASSEVKKDIFKKLMKRDFEYFETQQQGEIMLKLNLAVRDMSNYISKDFTNLITNFLRLLIIFVFMISFNWFLGLIILASYIVIGGIVYLISIPLRARAAKLKETEMKVLGVLLDNITGFTLMQAYNRSYKTLSNFEDIAKRHTKNRNAFYTRYFSMHPLTDTIASVAVCVIVGLSALLFAAGRADIGIVVAFLGLVTDSLSPIREVTNAIGDLIYADSVSNKAAELLPDAEENPADGEITTERPNIEFINVCNTHTYKGTVLENINLKINYGEHILITGLHGSGKSTFGMLLLGLYQASKGRVLIDGKNIKKIKKQSLHKLIGFAGESPFLFNDTIYNNILVANPTATEEDVISAAERSGLRPVIGKLRKGFDTVVNKDFQFSAGDRQLLGLARLMLANPKIIILDEALLELDLKTRFKYQENLSELAKDKTLIYISGRKNINIFFDKEITVKKGKISGMKKYKRPTSKTQN